MKPSRHQFNVLNQIIDLLPCNLVPKLAREHGVDRKRRKECHLIHKLAPSYKATKKSRKVKTEKNMSNNL